MTIEFAKELNSRLERDAHYSNKLLQHIVDKASGLTDDKQLKSLLILVSARIDELKEER